MSIFLSSSKNIDCDRLQNLLLNQKWGEADDETYDLMVRASGKQKGYLLNSRDIQAFPCESLRILNEIWLQNSNFRFGFSVQSKIWRSLSISENNQDSFVEDKYREF